MSTTFFIDHTALSVFHILHFVKVKRGVEDAIEWLKDKTVNETDQLADSEICVKFTVRLECQHMRFGQSTATK